MRDISLEVNQSRVVNVGVYDLHGNRGKSWGPAEKALHSFCGSHIVPWGLPKTKRLLHLAEGVSFSSGESARSGLVRLLYRLLVAADTSSPMT